MQAMSSYTFEGIMEGQKWWTRDYPSGAGTMNATADEAFSLYNIYYPLRSYHYRYELSGDKESGYSLVERVEDSPPEDYHIQYNTAFTAIEHLAGLVSPVSNEIRPLNTAVRYFIRAR